MQAAEHQLRAAKFRTTQAVTDWLPTGSVSLSQSRTGLLIKGEDKPIMGSPLALSINGTLPLLRSYGRRDSYRQAKQEIELAQARYDATWNALHHQIWTAAEVAYTARRKFQLYSATAASLRNLANSLERKARANVGASGELRQINNLILTNAGDIGNASTEIAIAEASFSAATNGRTYKGQRFRTPGGNSTRGPSARLAQANYELARSEEQRQASTRRPQFDLVGVARKSRGFDTGTRTESFSVGVRLTIPFGLSAFPISSRFKEEVTAALIDADYALVAQDRRIVVILVQIAEERKKIKRIKKEIATRGRALLSKNKTARSLRILTLNDLKVDLVNSYLTLNLANISLNSTLGNF